MNTHLGELSEMLNASLNGDTTINRRAVIREIGETLPTVEQWRREIGQYHVPIEGITPEQLAALLTAERYDFLSGELDLVTGPLA